MQIVGLTGSVAMGKTHIAKIFRRYRVAVFDADACVHRLMQPNTLLTMAIQRTFPQAVNEVGSIDRKALASCIFADPLQRRALELLVHPHVAQAREQFIRRCRQQRRRLCVLDIPLLFETGGDAYCDHVIVVVCPVFLQAQRFYRRGKGTQATLQGIRAAQWPVAVKQRCADTVITTGGHRGDSHRQIQRWLVRYGYV